MLQSGRFPYPKGMLPRGEQDVQFSHSRIIDSLRLPATYRSLARPSSALEPSHPPCGVTAVLSKRVTQLASRLRMQRTVIGSRAEARLTPWAHPRSLSHELSGFQCEPPEGGWNGSTRASGARPVDAPGFEPGASPLQGERSTADLRAPPWKRGRAIRALVFQ